MANAIRYDFSLLSDDDIYLFNEGRHYHLYEKLGAHPATCDGTQGVYFSVWAPNARDVAVMGDFNGWDRQRHYLSPRGSSGIWEGFIPDIGVGNKYKYFIRSHAGGYQVEKADPFARCSEQPPKTASVICKDEYSWSDQEWMQTRHQKNSLKSPISIYEVHLGSWKRVPEENFRPLTFREVAPSLAEYLNFMGFSHVEFLPLMEHPFYGSWGYQTTGYFAPTSRYGSPEDLKYLIDHLHGHGIGVVLDWVPSHFPNDEHGLAYFDGTHLFEHSDPRQGFHPDWKSAVFNYGRNEVRSFLMSSAMFWLNEFHIDGLRVDAVASMLYLDYSRKEGEWIPNQYGGRENLDAIHFLRQLNEAVYLEHPDVQTIAEESTAWPMVSRPTYVGGLGFGLKWDMGWMHDTLQYMSYDPIYRRFHQNEITFRMIYAFTENYVLPLSHDEVVHGKGSLLNKMPGDNWQKFANLRALLGYMFAQPSKKLLFMGGEFGQWREWSHETSIEWHLTQFAPHAGVQAWVQDLNHLYFSEPAMHALDTDPSGFEWVDASDAESSTLSFLRYGPDRQAPVLAVFNFTPIPRHNYRVGVPFGGHWKELLNSDAERYGGTGIGNFGGVNADSVEAHGRRFSLNLSLPPLGVVFFKPQE